MNRTDAACLAFVCALLGVGLIYFVFVLFKITNWGEEIQGLGEDIRDAADDVYTNIKCNVLGLNARCERCKQRMRIGSTCSGFPADREELRRDWKDAETSRCGDCNAIGKNHHHGCKFLWCKESGTQALFCRCDFHEGEFKKP